MGQYINELNEKLNDLNLPEVTEKMKHATKDVLDSTSKFVHDAQKSIGKTVKERPLLSFASVFALGTLAGIATAYYTRKHSGKK